MSRETKHYTNKHECRNTSYSILAESLSPPSDRSHAESG